MSDASQAARKALEARITAKAWKDEQFRQDLQQNPKKALERELGHPIPDGLKIVIHEETPDTIHFVLPARPSVMAHQELSDEDLESVAGGMQPVECYTWEGTACPVAVTHSGGTECTV